MGIAKAIKRSQDTTWHEPVTPPTPQLYHRYMFCLCIAVIFPARALGCGSTSEITDARCSLDARIITIQFQVRNPAMAAFEHKFFICLSSNNWKSFYVHLRSSESCEQTVIIGQTMSPGKLALRCHVARDQACYRPLRMIQAMISRSWSTVDSAFL